jgi:hypothetical protein
MADSDEGLSSMKLVIVCANDNELSNPVIRNFLNRCLSTGCSRHVLYKVDV